MKSNVNYHDVIVIGAGAAGLACALKLNEYGTNFLLLEARSRVGGRILSKTRPPYNVPIEMGAEFIHGAPLSTLEIFGKFNCPFYDVLDDHYFRQNNRLKIIPDYWDKLGRIMDKVKARKRDIPINEFLSSLKPEDSISKTLFKSYVEGFQASDMAVTGTKALATAEETEEGDINGGALFRPSPSYQSIFQKIHESIAKERVLLNAILKNIEWSQHGVKIKCAVGKFCEERIYRCKKLILTVPLGVLKSGQITWNKKPKFLDKILAHLEMGHVQKIIFVFKNRFWERLTRKPLAFFHSDIDHFFPTWWTYQPLRYPYLVAWQGGPKAKEMSNWKEKERIKEALKTLEFLTGRSESSINSQLLTYHTHNWSKDVFSLGAYSYISVDGAKIAAKLASPIENTIYFAGEATVMGPGRGTVHGAINSGQKAAHLIRNCKH